MPWEASSTRAAAWFLIVVALLAPLASSMGAFRTWSASTLEEFQAGSWTGSIDLLGSPGDVRLAGFDEHFENGTFGSAWTVDPHEGALEVLPGMATLRGGRYFPFAYTTQPILPESEYVVSFDFQYLTHTPAGTGFGIGAGLPYHPLVDARLFVWQDTGEFAPMTAHAECAEARPAADLQRHVATFRWDGVAYSLRLDGVEVARCASSLPPSLTGRHVWLGNTAVCCPDVAYNDLRFFRISTNVGGTGTYTSPLLDSHERALAPLPSLTGPAISRIDWNATVPPNATLQIEVRAGDDPSAMGDWTSVVDGDALPLGLARYQQWRARLGANDVGESPVLHELTLTVAPDATS